MALFIDGRREREGGGRPVLGGPSLGPFFTAFDTTLVDLSVRHTGDNTRVFIHRNKQMCVIEKNALVRYSVFKTSTSPTSVWVSVGHVERNPKEALGFPPTPVLVLSAASFPSTLALISVTDLHSTTPSRFSFFHFPPQYLEDFMTN